jgi:hypothetical protein
MNPAVHPGINRICLKLRLKPDNLSDLASPKGIQGTPQQRSDSKTPNHPPSPYAAIAFDESDMPPKEVYEPLIFDVFFNALAQHFPSIQRLRLQNRLADGTMSAFLLNGMYCIKSGNTILPVYTDVAICAISARFASPDKAYHANVRCLSSKIGPRANYSRRLGMCLRTRRCNCWSRHCVYRRPTQSRVCFCYLNANLVRTPRVDIG